MKSWHKSYHVDLDTVTKAIRDCVTALRRRGLKTDTALRDLGPALGTNHRRIRTFFHRDYEPVVLIDEWMALRARLSDFFYREAEYHLELHEEYKARGREFDDNQLEFEWERQCHGSTGYSHGRTWLMRG